MEIKVKLNILSKIAHKKCFSIFFQQDPGASHVPNDYLCSKENKLLMIILSDLHFHFFYD